MAKKYDSTVVTPSFIVISVRLPNLIIPDICLITRWHGQATFKALSCRQPKRVGSVAIPICIRHGENPSFRQAEHLHIPTGVSPVSPSSFACDF